MGLAGTRAVALATLFSSMLVGCGEQPSKVDGAPSAPPSESYQLESGKEEGFLWRCVNGERVRMWRTVDGKRKGKWNIARGPCGSPMPDEPAPFVRRPMSGVGWW